MSVNDVAGVAAERDQIVRVKFEFRIFVKRLDVMDVKILAATAGLTDRLPT